eukprot:TRINITY_DN2391_c0_g1_i2.p1 TRINITY_DN2391_c0_g1~~TRINITY_DN2391_c0_g1_i2.p1  ORF type:complete len:476 (-),score=102.93 TRINITY_DN2391_c0_g1_i2:638-2065(-)
MKFSKRFRRMSIAEWRDKYVDYKRSKKLLKAIRLEAVDLATSQQKANQKKSDSDSDDLTINWDSDDTEMVEIPRSPSSFNLMELSSVRVLDKFFHDEVTKVEDFYEYQISKMTEQFHQLVARAVALDLLPEYIPVQKNMIVAPWEKDLIQRFGMAPTERSEEPPSYLDLDDESFPLKRIIKSFPMDLEGDEPHSMESFVPYDRISIMEASHLKDLPSPDVLKFAFREFYRGLTLLEDYGWLNGEAIRKFSKKCRKNFGFSCKVDRPLHFLSRTQLKLLTAETENVFASIFMDGDRGRAMKSLRVPKEKKKTDAVNFRTGTVLGICFSIILVLIGTGFNLNVQLEGSESARIMFRMLGAAIVMIFAWALDLQIWERFKINYVHIAEFDKRTYVRWNHLVEVGWSLSEFALAGYVFWIFLSINIFLLEKDPMASLSRNNDRRLLDHLCHLPTQNQLLVLADIRKISDSSLFSGFVPG